MPSRPWLLYVDESGDQGQPGDLLVVAGLLVREPEHPDATALLGERLREVFPLCPWPPHATDLKIPASRVAYHLLAPPAAGEPPSIARLRAVAGPLALRIGTSGARALRGFVEAIAAGEVPDFADLQVADAWCRRADPQAWHALQVACWREDRAMRGLISDLAASLGPGDALVLVAADRVDDGTVDTAPPAGCIVLRDPYVRLLETLGERLLGLRRSATGLAEYVEARVANRDVHVLGIPVGLDLKRVYVADILAGAEGFPCSPAARRSVRLVPVGHVHRYNASAHPLLVVADYLANRFRDLLLRDPQWAAVEACPELGLLPESRLPVVMEPRGVTHGPLPAVAAGGAPRDRVRAVFETGVAMGCADLAPLWARAQAEAWVASLGGGRWP